MKPSSTCSASRASASRSSGAERRQRVLEHLRARHEHPPRDQLPRRRQPDVHAAAVAGIRPAGREPLGLQAVDDPHGPRVRQPQPVGERLQRLARGPFVQRHERRGGHARQPRGGRGRVPDPVGEREGERADDVVVVTGSRDRGCGHAPKDICFTHRHDDRGSLGRRAHRRPRRRQDRAGARCPPLPRLRARAGGERAVLRRVRRRPHRPLPQAAQVAHAGARRRRARALRRRGLPPREPAPG